MSTAFAGSLRQARGITYNDFAARVINEAAAMQGLGDQGHGRAPHAEQRANRFLSRIDAAVAHALLTGDEPAAQPLIRRVYGIAGCEPLRLRVKPVATVAKHLAKFGILLRKLGQLGAVDLREMSANQHGCSRRDFRY